jgi:hypothetical protein
LVCGSLERGQPDLVFSFRDWKDHKMVCGITMDMDPAVRDESYSLIAGPDGLARLRAEMGFN